MKDKDKTKQQLLSDLTQLRQRVAELEAMDAERNRAQDMLKQSQEDCHKLFEANPFPLIITRLADSQLIRANQAALDYFEGRADELATTQVLAFYADPADRSRIVAELETTGRVSNRLLEIKTRTGKRKWAMVNVFLTDFEGQRCLLSGFADITEHKQVEEALRESEAKYRRLIETTAEGYWLITPQSATIDVNQALCDMLGYSREEMLGKTPFDFVDEENRKIFAASISRMAEQDQRSYEITLRRKNGEALQTHFNATTLRDASGKAQGSFAMVSDITERQQAEERLRLQSAALEAAANSIVITDREGTILWTNPAFTALTGYSIEQVIGRNPRILKSGLHDQAFYQNLWQTILSGQVWRNEIMNRRRDGSLYVEEMTLTPVRSTGGEITHFVAIKQDVTERKWTESKLRETKDQLETILQGVADGIDMLDATGRLVYANEAAARAAGYPSVQAMLQAYDAGRLLERYDILDESGQPFPIAQLPGRVALQGKQTRAVTLCYRSKSTGEERWSVVQATPICDEQDRLQFIVSVTHDITERKRAEQALEERMRFETLLSDLSATLINLPVSEVDQAIQQGLERMVELLDADWSTLSEFSEGQTRLYVIHSYTRPGIPPAPTLITNEEFPWHIEKLRRGEMVLVERVGDLPAEATRDKESALKMGYRSNLAIPLTVGRVILGVISFGSFRREQAWPRELVPRLRLIGEILANALARKRAEEALARHDRAMAALYETSLEINSQPDVTTLLHAMVRRAAELLGTQMGGLYLMRPDGRALELVVGHNLPRDYTGVILPLGEGLSGRIAQTGEPMMVADYAHWDKRASVYTDDYRTRRVLGAPLRVSNRIVGVINVTDDQKAGPFDEDQIRLLSLFADQAAIAVESARLIEALRRSNAELQARNEELDAFAHTVAHDLKTPLGLVIGYAELSKEDLVVPGDELGRHLSLVARNGRKMSSIIDNLLLLAETRSAEVSQQPLEMGRIVAESLERLAHIIQERQAEIVLPAASEWPVALGYAPWIEEVWVNYLSNALKYGGQPPHVELGADLLPHPYPPPLAGEGGGMVRFWVRDNGPGIPPEAQARLFTPFKRLDQTRIKGHGLGLSIVRRIVEKLGGQVSVESRAGEGSVFSFTLPGASG